VAGSGLPGVVAVTASEANDAPEVAWGDSFFFYDPEGDEPADQRLPFATIVTQDYDGFDMASNLNRHGIYRLNLAVGQVALGSSSGIRRPNMQRTRGTSTTASWTAFSHIPCTPPKLGCRF
jgi:hypothetical protein